MNTITKNTEYNQAIKLPLSQGKFVLLDKEDFIKLSIHKWCFNGSYKKNGYAVRNIYPIDRKHPVKVYMHRVIMKARKGQLVDHINRNTLDCRKVNLRFATRRENLLNSDKFINKKHEIYI